MDGIHEGIDVAGRALIDESRRTGRPLATCRDGKVVLVDADGHPVLEARERKEVPQ
jgi:hypothetical protein